MDIYAVITDHMIQEMETGIIPWRKPWMSSGAAISHTTGKPYSLLNQMPLGKAGEWLTFKQCQEEGGFVKKVKKAAWWSSGACGHSNYFKPEEAVHIYASVLPENATYPHLRWSSSDENAASVGEDGVIILHREGPAVLTAQATDGSGIEAACTISALSFIMVSVT